MSLPRPAPDPRGIASAPFVTVGAAYAAHGFGYAATVAGLAFSAARYGWGDGVITVLLLVVCLGAAAGSVLADVVADRCDSRWALTAGLGLQAGGLLCVLLGGPAWLFIVGVVLYAPGLGCVDAATAMQGVVLQARRGAPVMGRFFAAHTAAGIVGALVTSAALGTTLGARGALVPAVVLDVGLVLVGPRLFAAETVPRPVDAAATPVPRGPLWFFGSLVLAAFVVDTSVSAWSTPHLREALHVSDSQAPLGYAAYLAVMLCSRLAVDATLTRAGAPRTTARATLAGVTGLVVVLATSSFGAAVTGLAQAGVVTGAVVPIAFGGAGAAAPDRPDAMVARVNLFNYAGALVGAVLTGALATATSTRFVYAVPLATLVVVLVLVRRTRTRSPWAPGTPLTAGADGRPDAPHVTPRAGRGR